MNNTEMTTSGVAGIIDLPEKEADADTILVKQYLNGDNSAFEALFRKYQGPVFNIASRMVSGEDAYDLTQDIFCNALRALQTFRGDSKFSTWLYSIARNACLNRIRQNSRIKEDSLEAITEDQPYAEFTDHSANVEKAVETHELQRAVNSVLATLSEDQRTIIVLRDFEQLSYEEISSVTGMSMTTVKSKLHRARMAFKIRFKPYLDSYKEGR